MTFVVGELYSHEQIMHELRVGNSGGVRVSMAARDRVNRVVLFSASEQEANVRENPYSDRSDGAILTYTGTGKIGDQSLAGPNRRIPDQAHGFFPIYVFSLYRHRKTTGSPEKRWRFAGIYKYVDHTLETQADLVGASRASWVFRLVRLPIQHASPSSERPLRDTIIRAYADPALSAARLLGKSAGYSSAEIAAMIRRMRGLSATGFEHLVKSALVASCFRDVAVTKQSSDGGIDVIARFPSTVWPVDKPMIQIQAKRWQRPVGRREVSQLRGSLLPHACGTIITTGDYCKTAVTEAERPNLMPVSLLNGYRFAVVVLNLKLEVS